MKNNFIAENIIKPEDRKRITVIVGHFGSGKTEFSVNLAFDMKKMYDKVAVLDMDIANPYFRSRERQDILVSEGIDIFYNTYGFDITEDLPAITAAMRGPMENPDYMTIVDAGGNDSGARILKQFGKYFVSKDSSQLLCVLNANRPETDTVEGMLFHIESIEFETGLKVDGIINNTHLLMETSPEDVLKGYRMCKEVSEKLDIPIVWNTCNEKLLDKFEALVESEGEDIDFSTVYPIKLYMRPSWLDR